MKVILLSNKTITTLASSPQTIANPAIGSDGSATGDGVKRPERVAAVGEGRRCASAGVVRWELQQEKIFASTPRRNHSAADIGQRNYLIFSGTIAPIFCKSQRSIEYGTSFTAIFCFAEIAAAHPAACPIAMQGACTRTALLASVSVEIHLPAQSIRLEPLGIKAPYGISPILFSSKKVCLIQFIICRSIG